MTFQVSIFREGFPGFWGCVVVVLLAYLGGGCSGFVAVANVSGLLGLTIPGICCCLSLLLFVKFAGNVRDWFVVPWWVNLGYGGRGRGRVNNEGWKIF